MHDRAFHTFTPYPNATGTPILSRRGKTTHEPFDVAELSSIKCGLPGERAYLFLATSQGISSAIQSNISENFRGEFSKFSPKSDILKEEIWQLSEVQRTFFFCKAALLTSGPHDPALIKTLRVILLIR